MKSKITIISYFKKGLIELVLNKYSIYLFLSSILCFFLKDNSPDKFWNPIIFLLWIIHFILFMYNVALGEDKSFVENWPIYFLIACMIIFWVVYSFIKINPSLAVFSLYFLFLFLFVVACYLAYRYGISFYDKTNNIVLVIKYLMFSTLIILIFSITYNVINVLSPSNAIVPAVQNVSMNTSRDYMYFSFQTYFLNSYGEYYPVGNTMRWATILETILTFVVTVFIIGGVLNNYRYKK